MKKSTKWTIEYYRYREYYCIPGTANYFFSFASMEDYYTKNYGACDFVKIATPKDATDDVFIW